MAEELYFRTKSGQNFDTASIAAFASKLGAAVRDPADRNRWMIFHDPAEAASFKKERRADPDLRLPYVCLVYIEPGRIAVGQHCGVHERLLARTFVEWLLGQYQCVVRDDEGNDLTEIAAQSAALLYESEQR